MKRADTQVFERQSKNRAFFSKLSNVYFDLRPPGQDRVAKTRSLGQLECANPQGSPGGGSGLELTDTLVLDSVETKILFYSILFYSIPAKFVGIPKA